MDVDKRPSSQYPPNAGATVQPVKPSEILGIKVMRLTKPTFQEHVNVYSEDMDIAGKALQDKQRGDFRVVEELSGVQPGMALQLPRLIGKMYLGESFNALVIVLNESSNTAKDVQLKVELLTPTDKFTVLSPQVTSHLDSGGAIEKVVSHEIRSMEDHTLSVAVSYIHQTGEEALIRKTFRLSILKPIDVKTKNRVVQEEGDILFEFQIENLMNVPIVIDHFVVLPAEGCTVVLQDYLDEANTDTSVFGVNKWVKPRDTRQQLFRITSAVWPDPVSTKDGRNYTSIVIGRVDITWLSAYGERGRIQTSNMTIKVDRTGDLLAQVSSSPGTVEIEKPFKITCLLKNLSKKMMKLRFLFENKEAGILWSGVSGKDVGELRPKQRREIEFTLVPIKPGLQGITGLRFYDIESKTFFQLKESKVYVVMPTSTENIEPIATEPL